MTTAAVTSAVPLAGSTIASATTAIGSTAGGVVTSGATAVGASATTASGLGTIAGGATTIVANKKVLDIKDEVCGTEDTFVKESIKNVHKGF